MKSSHAEEPQAPPSPAERLVRCKPKGDLTVVYLNRPEKRNALNLPLIHRLTEAVDGVIRDPTVTGVIIAGRGPTFCAGVDLNEFASATPETATELIQALKGLCATIFSSTKPVAFAIHGFCIGGALEMAMAADFRVATDDARFAMPEVTIGIPSVIHAALLPHYIGIGRARQMLLTGDAVTARTAHDWGLINYVVADEQELLGHCATILHRVTKNYPEAVKGQKRLLQAWLNSGLDDGVESSVSALSQAFATGVPQDLARRLLEDR